MPRSDDDERPERPRRAPSARTSKSASGARKASGAARKTSSGTVRKASSGGAARKPISSGVRKAPTGGARKGASGGRESTRGASARGGGERSAGRTAGKGRPARRDADGLREAASGAAKRTRRSAPGDRDRSRARGDGPPARAKGRPGTRGGKFIDQPSPKYRRRGEAETPEERPGRPPTKFRLEAGSGPKGRKRDAERAASSATAKRRGPAPKRVPAGREHPARRRRRMQSEAVEELTRLAGGRSGRVLEQLARAAEAFGEGRERDAVRILRPLRDAYRDAAGVRELLGLALYRSGHYADAAKELDTFVALTGSVEQHPVLMDCARAAGDYARVEELWSELAATSPSGALVVEGRIVLAGALADQGRVRDAIARLERRASPPRQPREHHLRLWYALGDLYERAGDVPRARALFEQVRRHDPSFADTAERLAALS